MVRPGRSLGIIAAVLYVLIIVGCTPRDQAQDQASLPKATLTELPRKTATMEDAETLIAGPESADAEGLTSPVRSCNMDTGEVLALNYPGTAVARDIPVRIYLPPCYGQADQKYPTVYALHGYPFDETQWEELGVIPILDAGISEGGWMPFILVMPLVPEPLFTRSDGGPGSYETELVEGLVPFIDENYETDNSGSARAVVGISRGGVWALETAFTNPEIFNTVAALSPSLSVNSARPPYDPILLARAGTGLPENIMVTGGTGEPGFLAGIEELIGGLELQGTSHYYLLTNGAHREEAWMEIIDDVMAFIAEGFSEEGAYRYVE